MSLIEVGACILVSATSQVGMTRDAVGWELDTVLELGGAPGCETVVLTLAPDEVLADWTGRVRAEGVANYRLPVEHRVDEATAPDGARVVTLWLPWLDEGERARIELSVRVEAAVDLHWAPPSAAGFAELVVPRRLASVVHERHGVRASGRALWTDRPALAHVHLRHPWADRDAPALPPTAAHEMAPDAALALLAPLAWVPPAWFGAAPPLGDDAVAAGAVDHRGVARTIAAMSRDHSSPAEVGRWSPAPDTAPLPGALEVAVVWAPSGPRLLPHPDQPLPAGVLHTPSGPVWITERAVAAAPRCTPLSAHVAITLGTDDPKQGWISGAHDVAETLTLPEGCAGAFVSLPPDATVEPSACARHVDGRGLWMRPTPGCTVVVHRPTRDAWGDRLGAPPAGPKPAPQASVGMASAKVATSLPSDNPGVMHVAGGRWWLSAWGEVPLITEERISSILMQRQHAAAYPEPGTPKRLRGDAEGWDLALKLRGLLSRRAEVRDLPTLGPIAPRPLVRARRSRLLSPTEAAMTVAQYGAQHRLDTAWGLAHPTDAPPQRTPVPERGALGVVRVRVDGEEAWIDVGCTVCATFELRPSLPGASVVGAAEGVLPMVEAVDGVLPGIVDDGPLWRWEGGDGRAGVGHLEVDASEAGGPEGTAQFRYEGVDALALRLALGAVPASDRRALLADRTGDADVAVSGLATRGAPVTLTAVAPDAFAHDPLAMLAVHGPSLRTWRRPAPPGASEASWSCGGADAAIAWRAAIRDGALIEQALVRTRAPTDADMAALRVCRERLAEP